ncbi:hypothetical protein [Paraburkholderia sp. BR10882]|uniref:hypothetical protein n=1 Tax=unclassified Paraburkholderia TaxID=2615204 RepID=UPI0034CE93E4
MDTKKPSAAPFSHLLRAAPEALAEMVRITHASIERDREREAQAETAKLIAKICAANNKRLGIAPPPAPTTALGRQILKADARRRGE